MYVSDDGTEPNSEPPILASDALAIIPPHTAWCMFRDVNTELFYGWSCIQAVVVNRELVHRGLARWLEM